MTLRWDLVLGLGLVGSFFLPWLQKVFYMPETVFGSGFNIANSPEIDGVYLYIVPALGGLVVLSALMRNFNNRWFRIFAGFIPLLVVGWSLYALNEQLGGDWATLMEALPVFVDWGLYVGIFFAFMLLIHGIFGKGMPG